MATTVESAAEKTVDKESAMQIIETISSMVIVVAVLAMLKILLAANPHEANFRVLATPARKKVAKTRQGGRKRLK
jgi:hypothetical protein